MAKSQTREKTDMTVTSKDREWALMLAEDEDLKAAWERHINTVPAVKQARNDYDLARNHFFDTSISYENAPDWDKYNEMKVATDMLAIATARLKLAERTGQ